MLLAERECDFFAAHGKMENDREARNFPSAARNIVELGRRQQPQSTGRARPRCGGKNVLAMSCDRQKRSKSARWRPCLSYARPPIRSGFFMERLREGLTVGHPDMPTFRFTREDARAFLLYLRSIQGP